MNKYFEIKPCCALYQDYFAYKEDAPKVSEAFENVRKRFGIESESLHIAKDKFRIVPTEADSEKFAGMMKKTNFGEFKKNSEPSKMWCDLVKDIDHLQKPKLIFYFKLMGHRWKERLFAIGKKLYCSIESDGEVFVPDFAIEMKASDFFKMIEDQEEVPL